MKKVAPKICFISAIFTKTGLSKQLLNGRKFAQSGHPGDRVKKSYAVNPI
jgi:hypothetical protein